MSRIIFLLSLARRQVSKDQVNEQKLASRRLITKLCKMIATQLPCYLVNNLTANSVEQCKFIIENGCQEDDALFDYVYLVYCELGLELRYLSIALIVFLVIILFLALSSVADEFLCPSLLTVARNLRMSDSLAVSSLLSHANHFIRDPPDINHQSIRASPCSRSAMDAQTFSHHWPPRPTIDLSSSLANSWALAFSAPQLFRG